MGVAGNRHDRAGAGPKTQAAAALGAAAWTTER